MYRAFDAGDRLRVHFQVIEGTRRRTQVFEGVVIKRQGHGARETFTVRKQSFGVGVERTFPLHSPKIERIEVAARGDVRRAKLYYLRGRVGKRARVRERRSAAPEVAVERELLHAPAPEEPAQAAARPPRRRLRRGRPRPRQAEPALTPRPSRSRAEAESGAEDASAEESEDSVPPTAPQDASPAAAEASAGERAGVTKARKSPASTLFELAVIVVTALGLALGIQAFLVKPYRIPSGSMLPTVHINQRVLVDRIGMDFSSPHVGDIIVFHPPKNYDDGCADPEPGPERRRAGRSGGVRGAVEAAVLADVHQARRRASRRPISIVNGHVIRNGKRENDSYIVPVRRRLGLQLPADDHVPPGDYYMMGDNRPDSEDSRFWGPVPRAWIIGKAFLTYWPPDRIGFL